VIPHTRQISLHPNWVDALDWAYPDAPSLWGTGVVSFNACPTVQGQGRKIYYSGLRWGYAVNAWWSNAGSQLNELKRWTAVAWPGRYPIFMDPSLYTYSDGFNASLYAPNTNAATGGPNWGVGSPHDAESANVAFADGAVRAVTMTEMRASAPGGGDFNWFAAGP
jgi:prepilin-type processing-associated H-X9-DG protein